MFWCRQRILIAYQSFSLSIHCLLQLTIGIACCKVKWITECLQVVEFIAVHWFQIMPGQHQARPTTVMIILIQITPCLRLWGMISRMRYLSPKHLSISPWSLNRLQSPRTEISSCLILSKLSRTCCSFHRVCRNQSSHAYIAGAWRQSPRIRTSIHFYRYNNIVVFWNTWSRFLHCQWLINLLVIVILSKDKETVE